MSKISTMKNLGISSFEVIIFPFVTWEDKPHRFTCEPETLYSKIEELIAPAQMNITKEDFMKSSLVGRPNATSFRWFPQFSVTMLEHHFSKASSLLDSKVSDLKGYTFNIKNVKTAKIVTLALGDDESIASFYRSLVKEFGNDFMSKTQFYSMSLLCHKVFYSYKVYIRGFEFTATKTIKSSMEAPKPEPKMVELKSTSVSSNIPKDETDVSWPTDGDAFKSGGIKNAPYEVSPRIQASAIAKPNPTKTGFIAKVLKFFKK